MPFKSAKQKTTIDAAAHNPTFAKKVGIKTSDAKKMSAHGKGQTKFKEAKDTVEKDEKGNVKSWKHEGDWKKTNNKEGRGKVTNLSDKARRQTAKMSKVETKMAEAFELALEGQAMGRIEQGVWVSDPKGKVPAPTGDPEGAGAKEAPAMRKQLKKLDKAPVKKAEVTPIVDTDDTPMTTAESSSKKVMKKLRAKHMMESIRVLGQLIAETKKITKKKNSKVKEDPNEGNAFGDKVRKAKADGIQPGEKIKVGKKEYPVKEAADDKCNHTTKGKKCPVHGLKECGMYESNEYDKYSEVQPAHIAAAPRQIGAMNRPDHWPGDYQKTPDGSNTDRPVVRVAGIAPKDRSAYMAKRGVYPGSRDEVVFLNDPKDSEKSYADHLKNSDRYTQFGEPVKPTPSQKIKNNINNIKQTFGLDEGKNKEKTYTINGKKKGDGNLANNAKPYDKITKGDVVTGRLGKDEMGGKSKKKKVKEGWTHDTLAAQLFESGDEYMVALRNKLDRQLKG